MFSGLDSKAFGIWYWRMVGSASKANAVIAIICHFCYAFYDLLCLCRQNLLVRKSVLHTCPHSSFSCIKDILRHTLCFYFVDT